MGKSPKASHFLRNFEPARVSCVGEALTLEHHKQFVHFNRHTHGPEIAERLAFAASLPLLLVVAHAGLAAYFAATGLESAVLALAQSSAAAVLALTSLAAVFTDG